VVVEDLAGLVGFLQEVFGATGVVEPGRPAELLIGDSLIMVSSSAEREFFPAFLYVYVDDAAAVYRKALEAGATSIEEPVAAPYGDLRAMFRDPYGNVFQVAHQLH
jgi:uncharacterized glyoxalase superfamily protein PhnB